MDLFKDKLIKILFFIFRNFYSDFIFIKLLNYFYNNRLPQIIIIICEPILFKKNISHSVYDIYFQSLRSLNLNNLCVTKSNIFLNLYPFSEIGYWHSIHAYIALDDIDKALNLIKLFNKKNINSKRLSSLCLGNKIVEKRLITNGINIRQRGINLFYNDSGLIGFSLLKFKFFSRNKNKNDFAIFISNHGGFSNLVTAILNAIGLARLLNINSIYLIKTELSEKFFSNNLIFGDISLNLIHKEPKVSYISGTFLNHFYFLEKFNPDFKNIRLAYARKILKMNTKSLSFLERDLVIHIRSGDIFTKKGIHPNYGQPPLSFYILCIKDFKPSSVTLIYEDTKNPVINLLIKYIQDIGCQLRRPTLKGIKEDISFIYNAKNVVCGNGTFVLGILMGSYSIQNLYIFEANKECINNWSLDRINNLNNIFDEIGIYRKNLLNKNWSKTKFQLWLMKNYPVENLKILKI